MSIVTHTGYIEGPRWALPAGTIRKAIIDSTLPLTLVDERRETSIMRCTIFYTIRGNRDSVSLFQRAIHETIAEYNGP